MCQQISDQIFFKLVDNLFEAINYLLSKETFHTKHLFCTELSSITDQYSINSDDNPAIFKRNKWITLIDTCPIQTD